MAPPELLVPDRRRETRSSLVESNVFLSFSEKFWWLMYFSSFMQRRNGRSPKVIWLTSPPCKLFTTVRFVRTNTPTPVPPSCSYVISPPQSHCLLVGKLRTKRLHERKLRTKPLLLTISDTCLGSTLSASFLRLASKWRRLDPLCLETFVKGNGRAPLRGRLLVRSPHLIRETPGQKPHRARVTFNHQ